MRIGLVTGEYPPMQGGVGAYTRILARTMADQGHEISILAPLKTHEEDSRILLSPVIGRWGVGSLNVIRQWVKKNRLDVVNIQYQTAAYGLSPLIHFIPDVVHSVPLVTTFHDLRFPYLFPKAGRLRDWIVMHLARASDDVIVTNHEDMSRLAHLPCTALIPIGSNILQSLPDEFDPQPFRERAGATSGDLLLAFFGLINRSKGLDVLLHALASLRADGIPARLVVIGGGAGSSDPTNAEYQREIHTMTDRLNLTSYIHTTGFLDEENVGKFLAASDMVLLPFRDGASYRRGSLMAAIRYGCPIVTTKPVVDVPAFVDGENMLLVPSANGEALGNAIIQLYHAPDLRQRLQDGARRLARQFEWSSIARETVAFFERVRGAQA
jgi:glycosyltransferase involved in cell wall biosynthesis